MKGLRIDLKIKYIDGEGWDWLDTYSIDVKRVKGYMNGMLSVVYNATVKYKLTKTYEDSSKVLFNDGFKCVTFLPDVGNWCVNAVYDENEKIVEWYFDVLKSKGLDLLGRHFYHDLYLDVVVQPDYRFIVIDCDELENALNDGIIDQDDFEMAYEVCRQIVNKVVEDKKFMEDFLRGNLEKYL